MTHPTQDHRSLLIEAEALLCDVNAGETGNELATRIRKCLERNEYGLTFEQMREVRDLALSKSDSARVQAVKHYRFLTGQGLKVAVDVIDAIQRGANAI